MLHRQFALALACLVPLAVHGQASATPGFNSSGQVYRCTGGAKLPVVYLNIDGADSFATIYVNGRLALLRSGPTGSGVNYYPVDEQLGYRWHVKGDLGNLWYRAAGPAARETIVLQDCKAVQA